HPRVRRGRQRHWLRAGATTAAAFLFTEGDRRFDLQIGIELIALGEKEPEGERLAVLQRELLGQLVEVETAGDLLVHTAQIEREVVVDEDPHVVIAFEVEGLTLAGVIDGGGGGFEREAVVVRRAIAGGAVVAGGLAVEREEPAVVFAVLRVADVIGLKAEPSWLASHRRE